MQSTGHASTHAVSFVPIQGSAITYAISPPLLPLYFKLLLSSRLSKPEEEVRMVAPSVPRYDLEHLVGHGSDARSELAGFLRLHEASPETRGRGIPRPLYVAV